MNLLKEPAATLPRVRFAATTPRALFVLCLARKLGDPAAVEHFAALAKRHNDETLLLAYRRTMNDGHPPRDLGRRFHEELAATREQDASNGQNGSGENRFLAIKIERRSIAVAVFVGMRLDYHDVRHLCAEPDKADGSALHFLSWVIGEFNITSAALEQMTNGNEIRRAGINRAVVAALRENVIPLWEVSKRELLEGYAFPQLRARADLREAAHALLWSSFNTPSPSAQELDAATLGLYIQTERLFLV